MWKVCRDGERAHLPLMMPVVMFLFEIKFRIYTSYSFSLSSPT